MQSCNNYFSQKPSNLKYHKCTFSFSTVNYKITSFSAPNSFSFLPYHFYKLIFFTKFVTFIAIPIKWCWFLKRATYCFSNHLSFLFTYFKQAHNRSTCICVCVCVCVRDDKASALSSQRGAQVRSSENTADKDDVHASEPLRHRDTNTSEQHFEVWLNTQNSLFYPNESGRLRHQTHRGWGVMFSCKWRSAASLESAAGVSWLFWFCVIMYYPLESCLFLCVNWM